MTEKTQAESPSARPGEDQLLGHVYDGIEEYDNPMPRWWVWMFVGSFWFSCAYLFHYWIGNGKSVNELFEEEMALVHEEAAKQALEQAVSEEVLQQFLADAASLAGGAEVYALRCSPCHAEKGEGSIGPNLTDDYWLHGKGELMDIYQVVAQGVLEKGMPAWDRQLTPAELRQVVAYVGSIRNTHVEGKAPEGEKH